MKFCFFGYVSCAINGRTTGGGELQMFLLAKALALKGHEVVIIDPYSKEKFVTKEGIKLINLPNWNKGLKGLRLFCYRIPALWKVLNEQRANFYYVRMTTYLHLIPYLAALKNGGKFIQSIASDIDLFSFSKKYRLVYKNNYSVLRVLIENLPDHVVFKYLLRRSDYVIVQHLEQFLYSKSLKTKTVLFPNIIDINNRPAIQHSRNSYYIYAGAITMLKGADKLYELIDKLDKTISIMVVGQPVGEKPKAIFEDLRKLDNVIIKGQLEHKETVELIANAKALINTSYFEGFPNIYLEAWSNGVPVISLNVNPGNIINRYDLGIWCEGDLMKMKSCIEGNEAVNFDKAKLITYVTDNHDFNTAADRFLKKIDCAV